MIAGGYGSRSIGSNEISHHVDAANIGVYYDRRRKAIHREAMNAGATRRCGAKYSSIDGFLGTGEQITTTLSGGSNCDDYRDHVITLHATDSDAHEATDQIHVVVSIFC